ncbi:hypothetical protein HPP92_010591 [Vanilla planifolia]|uniref:Uncharacterized protein n=1 Tax=Vanilla planifolia TaxID=51239 RepID=A0A835R9Q4_VANPL|nr:hypothetical protein HPP92_010591 [Vanilla planifolia]
MSSSTQNSPKPKPSVSLPSSNSTAGGVSHASGRDASRQCLCSPTTHQGSFRCRYHRSLSSAWFRRSKSMPSAASKPSTAAAAAAGKSAVETA